MVLIRNIDLKLLSRREEKIKIQDPLIIETRVKRTWNYLVKEWSSSLNRCPP